MAGLKRKYNSNKYSCPRPSKQAKTGYSSVTDASKKRYILGKTQRGTLRYAEKVTIASPAVEGTIGTWVFSANGCYDPNISGIGHQPRGFDQIMPLYDHYTVLSSKISVRFANDDILTRPYVGIAVRDTNVSLADWQAIGEYGDKVMSTKSLTNHNQLIEGSSFLSTKTNIASFLGRKGGAMSDPQLKGNAATNPTEQVFYHVVVGDVNSSNACSVDAFVIIEYDVIFHEPRQPTSS